MGTDPSGSKGLDIEKERLELDKQRMQFDQRFWHRNFGTMTTFAVAFLGLVLSIAQVWVAYVGKDREAAEREHENTIAQSQKDQELKIQEMRDLREFVAKNQGDIFSTDPTKREKVRTLMLTTFTTQVAQPVFEKLFQLSPPEQQSEWAHANSEVTRLLAEEAKPLVYVQYQDKNDASLADGLITILAGAGYRTPGKQLVVQPTKGDVRFFHIDDKDQADQIAKLVHDYLKTQGRDQDITPLFAGRTFPNVASGLFEVWIPRSVQP